jgi:hypothetical protein
VEVTLLDKTRQTGTLKDADDTRILITQKVIEKEGNKKKEVEKEMEIPFPQIEKTVVKIAF